MADSGEKSLFSDISSSSFQSDGEKSLPGELASLDIRHDWGSPSNGYLSSKLSEFKTSYFPSHESLHSHRSEASPYSLRQTQLSIPYQYDVLLLYDPDDDECYLNDLMRHLAPQDLKIFDFNRDAPAGLPPQKVLQSTFKMCRYTCILITEKFITNFWLQFRADMSIQDMLDNTEKLYSVIVVVMDRKVKKEDLPLDLLTLSPLFITDRYFTNRITRTFSKNMPFPPSVHTSSDFSKQPLPISHLPPSYSDITNKVEPFASISTNHKHCTPDNLHCSNEDEAFVSQQNSIKNVNSTPAMQPSSLASLGSASRLPREHSDNTYLMPPSLFESVSLEESSLLTTARTMRRESSVIVSSTGSRQPRELLEHTADNIKEHKVSSSKAPSYEGSCSEENSSMNMKAIETLPDCDRLLGNNFSSSNQDGVYLHDGETFNQDFFRNPGFFSINSIQSGFSEYSDLEISELSQPHSISNSDRDESLTSTSAQVSLNSASDSSLLESPHLRDNEPYHSLPRIYFRNVGNEPTIPRCNSAGLDRNNVTTHTKCSDSKNKSLPERSACRETSVNRSFSMRSLFRFGKSKKKSVPKVKKK